VVQRQVGANDAVWEQEGARIISGKETKLKIGFPETSCLKTEDE
jgi:hypothetical protein